MCKTLFTSHLWRPARYLQPAEPGRESTQHGARPPVRGMGQSADQTISIGCRLNVQSLRHKTDAVEELVRDRSLDVLALTETWHTHSDDVSGSICDCRGSSSARSRWPRRRHHLQQVAQVLPSSSASQQHVRRYLRAGALIPCVFLGPDPPTFWDELFITASASTMTLTKVFSFLSMSLCQSSLQVLFLYFFVARR